MYIYEQSSSVLCAQSTILYIQNYRYIHMYVYVGIDSTSTRLYQNDTVHKKYLFIFAI